MKRRINYFLLGLVIFLVLFGALFFFTLSSVTSLNVFGNTYGYLLRYITKLGIGALMGFIIFLLPLSLLKKLSLALLIINIIFLVAVFLPPGFELKGAARWINLGFFSFQPAEFIKLTSILYLAALISKGRTQNPKKHWIQAAKKGYNEIMRVFVPFVALLLLLIILLYFQKDLGTLGIICATLIIVYFVSGTPLWHMLVAFGLAVASAAVFIAREPYRIERLKSLINPYIDPLNASHQITQSLIAIGSGGIFGKGWGMSVQKFGFLPEVMGDSIFAVFAEELGFLGSLVLVASFSVLFWLGLRIAKNCHDPFSKLTAVGIVTWITLQAFINIGAVTGLIPLTGIPLPFFSYGGSHIITELIAMGILLKISKNS